MYDRVSQVTPNHYATPTILEALKVSIAPIAASFSSLSLPVLIIFIEQKFGSQAHPSLEQKILLPAVPYAIIFVLRNWLLRNSIAHRLDGRVDTPQAYAPDDKDAPWHVLMAILANIPSFTNTALAVNVALSNTPPPVLWSGAVVFGALSYTVDLYTVVGDAFRKHVESKQKQNQHIMPFFKQKYVGTLLFNYAEPVGKFLREILPILHGIIRAVVTTQTTSALLASRAPENAIRVMNVPLGLLTYWGSAYTARFDLLQLQQNLRVAGKEVIIDNWLTQATVTEPATRIERLTTDVQRQLGKTLSGEILVDTLQRLKFSFSTSVNITLVPAAIGFMALILKALHEYGKGFLIPYYAGEQTATRLAPNIEVGIVCTAVFLGILGTFAKSGTLRQQVPRSRAHQVTPDTVVTISPA